MSKILFALIFIATSAFACGDSAETPTIASETNCSDGVDNDGDGTPDCADPDCAGNLACQSIAEVCNNRLDDDNDGDTDCDDSDCSNNANCQTADEICTNGADDNGNGLADCEDPSCVADPTCQATPETCDDQTDNDEDGDTDCDDSDCAGDPACQSTDELCDNAVDDNSDGLIDCDDPTCTDDAACQINDEVCDDDIDNDEDGDTDCADADCADAVHCQVEDEICDDDIDNDQNGQTDCDDANCADDVACVGAEICDDDIDNDEDGDTDCADSDCTDAVHCLPDEVCDDGIDNDQDDSTDCSDADCANDPICVEIGNCGDGIDNDQDDDTDCDDTDCVIDPACVNSCENAIHVDDFGQFSASTGVSSNFHKPSCAFQDNSNAPEQVFVWTPETDTAVCVDTNGSDFDTVLYVRTDCDDDNTEIMCDEDGGEGARSEIQLDGVSGTRYFFFVDGYSTRSGNVLLNVRAGDCDAPAPEVCNDNVDNDRDGDTDCDDADCVAESACLETGNCDDGDDNDQDGNTDCADPDCFDTDACPAVDEVCDDGVDNDQDGDTDCDDTDCADVPCGQEICDDGIDNTRDDRIDCDDDDCIAEAVCIEAGNCSDGIDNDQDGDTDCADDACVADPQCIEAGNCTDELDNDGDGNTDCDDDECIHTDACFIPVVPEDCENGVDDNNDGATDCADRSCSSYPLCIEADNCADGIDNDLDGDTDCTDFACTFDPACIEADNCTDGIDNDLDGLEDCDDSDCANAAFCLGVEDCDNGFDDDSDGDTDCDDTDCDLLFFCTPEVCDDRFDNNRNGETDCNDAGCAENPVCEEICDDTIDNNGNGQIDCDDENLCLNNTLCDNTIAARGESITISGSIDETDLEWNRPDTSCDSAAGGTDRFYDAFTVTNTTGVEQTVGFAIAQLNAAYIHVFHTPFDAHDPETNCVGGGSTFGADSDPVDDMTLADGESIIVVVSAFNNNPAAPGAFDIEISTRNNEEIDCTDGIDNDLDGYLDCADNDCATEPRCGAEICDDGFDNDGNVFVDCQDSACAADPSCIRPFSCEDPGEIVGPGVFTGNTSSADFYNNPQTCAVSRRYAPEHVWAWTAPADTTICADTRGSTFHTALYVRTGDCDPAQEVACDTVEGGDFPGYRNHSFVHFEAVAGETYFFIVDGYNNIFDDTGVPDSEYADTYSGAYILNMKEDCVLLPEICDDGVDNDGDVGIDCFDDDCALDPFCVAEVDCTDGFDNDADRDTDCADPDCATDPACREADNCGDGIDNDLDGETDCADPDCAVETRCGSELCEDDFDNDGNGAADCDDENSCLEDPACDNAIAAPGESVTVRGSIDDTDLQWDLISESCRGGGEADHFYDAFMFTNTTGSDQTIHVFASWDEFGFVHIFRAPFDASDPRTNCIAGGNIPADNTNNGGQILDVAIADEESIVVVVSSQRRSSTIGAFDVEVLTQDVERVCGDGVDNDADGQADCDDSDCALDPNCLEAGQCEDGVDNDLDGDTDCADTDCATHPTCEEICDDDIDNDQDGQTDCDDEESCLEDTACDNEIAARGESITLTGSIDDTDLQWALPRNSCRNSIEGVRRFYDAFVITNTTGIEQTIDLDGSSSAQGYLHVFRSPFDVDAPTTNCIIGQSVRVDLNVIELEDITIAAGESLVVVASSFVRNEASGPFDVEVITNTMEEICDDGVDDDGDGFTDCEDSDCSGDISCDL